jgi:predicted  nucleic acid-binding Zn-ribbon protein
MNASPNEVTLILDAINDVRKEVKDVKEDVTGVRSDVSAMDKRINGRIRKLEQFRWQLVGAGALGVIALNVALRFI